MKNERSKRILLIITNPFAATNVIHSGLINLIAQRYQVHILSDLVREKEIAEINRRFGIQVESFSANIPVENRTLALLRKLEKALFFRHFGIINQTIKEQTNESSFQYLVKAVLYILDSLNLNKSLLKLLRNLIIRQSSKSSDLRERISAHQFSGMISTSPLDIRENIVVNSMKQTVRSLAMVISWDNLTTKGLINADYDFILVWNQFMAREYQTFYEPFSIGKQKIAITGIQRFDQYFGTNPNEIDKTKHRQRFHFDDDDKIILFATSAAKHFPDQIDIVYHLAEYSQDRPKVKIMVRCHPGDSVDRYQVFEREENIRIGSPEKLVGEGPSIPALNTLLSLHEALKYSDVCIQVASTMRLDAAACNKPIISIAYDGNKSQPYSKSVMRFYDYDHQIPLNKLRIDRMVFSKQELFNALDDTLFSPNVYVSTNRELVKEFTHFSEPHSITTTMKFIEEWLN